MLKNRKTIYDLIDGTHRPRIVLLRAFDSVIYEARPKDVRCSTL